MAARVLLQRRAVAPWMAATLVGGALYPSVSLAEAPPSDLERKKPIYDDWEAPLPKADTPVPSPASATIPDAVTTTPALPSSDLATRGPTPTDRLAVQVGRARLFLYHQAVRAEDAVNRTVDRAFSLEQSFTATVASLAPARESGERLMPGLVYVLVASMAGTIVSRNRNILLRAATPLAFGVGAGWVLLPVTMTNVSDLLWTYEKRVPALAEAHLKTRQRIERGVHFAKVHADIGKGYVDEKVTDARDLVEGWVQKGK